MTFTIHDAAVPPLLRGLTNLAAILEKGAAFAEAKGFDPGVLLSARLAPDMFPLSRQVQVACDSAKGVARIAAVEVPSHPDTETSFPELQDRIDATRQFVEGLSAAQFDRGEERIVTLPMRGSEMKLPGSMYLFGFVLPNFYFHVTTAYAILRHNGVEVSKRDFLGGG